MYKMYLDEICLDHVPRSTLHWLDDRDSTRSLDFCSVLKCVLFTYTFRRNISNCFDFRRLLLSNVLLLSQYLEFNGDERVTKFHYFRTKINYLVIKLVLDSTVINP